MKTGNRRMTKFASGLLLFTVLLMGPQLAAYGEPRYPILDSKFPAAEAKLGWIDNERVIFHGYNIGKMTQPGPGEGHPTAAEGLFIWDTVKGTVSKYWDINGPVPLCVFHDRVSFLLRLKSEDKIRLRVMGKLGEEVQIRTVGDDWVNSFSCRYHETKPEWFDKKRVRVGLREEHGYLDFGPRARLDSSGKARVVLYRPNETGGMVLPLDASRVLNLIEFSEFESAYVIKGIANTTDVVPVWLLRRDGTATNILEPSGKTWERLGWDAYHLTKKGLFLVGGRGGYAEVGKSGGYLLSQDPPARLIAGHVRNVSVSPNGCKVAFVHVLHSQAGADSFRALQAGKPGTRTLKIINLCKGD